MLVYCIQTAEDIVKLFSRHGSPMILYFLIPSADTQFPGEPLQRGRKIHGRWGKNGRFSTEIAVYLGNNVRYADGYYETLIGSHGCRIEWYHFR